jgi:hypothetical protein
MRKRYIDYIVESFRKGYCERIYIQTFNIEKAINIAFNEYNITINKNGYFVC